MNYRKDKRKFLSLEKDERYTHLSKEFIQRNLGGDCNHDGS